MLQRLTPKKALLPFMVALLILCTPILTIASSDAQTDTWSQYGLALLTGDADSLVDFKAEVTDDSFTIAEYWQGLEVQCETSMDELWVLVRFLNQKGYVKRENLMPGEAFKEGVPSLPEMVVANGSGAWLNLREEPSRDAKVLGKYLTGQLVTFYGIIHTPIQDGNDESTWAHVRTADGQTGFMVPAYLWNHSPFTLPFVSERVYEANQHMNRGVTARVTVAENFATQSFIAEALLTFDRPYTTNDDIAGFNLYINDVVVGKLEPTPDPEKSDAAPSLFFGGFTYHDAIDKVHLVAVLQEAGENPSETLLIYQHKE